MQINIRLLNTNAKVPMYQTQGSACFDISTCISEPVVIEPKKMKVLDTGLCFAVPSGYVLNIHSRSGHGFKHGLRMVNCTGVIDSDYRGEVKVGLYNDSDTPYTVTPGERIAQGMIVPIIQANLVVVGELDETSRGTGGFGSTGK